MIEIISHFLHWLGAATIGSFWLPLLLWTAAALPIYGVLCWQGVGPPHVRYYIFQGLLLALPVGFVIGGLLEVGALLDGIAPGTAADAEFTTIIALPEVQSTTQSPAGSAWNIYHGFGLLTLLAVVLAGWRLLALVGEAVKIYLLRCRLNGQHDRRVHHTLVRLRREMRVRRHVQALVTPRDTVPMTFGVFRPTIVIPAAMASRPDQLRMTLAHELTHVRRWDYLRGLIERLISSLFAVQPMTWRLQRQISSCREMACDIEVLELLSCSKRAYAALLFETSMSAGREPFALAMSDNPHHLKRRILAMKAYAGKSLASARTAGLAAGIAVVLIAGVISGCATRQSDTYLNVKVGAWELIVRSRTDQQLTPPSPEPSTDEVTTRHTSRETSSSQNEDASEVFVAVEQMPKLKGGLSALAEKINYPEEARQAGIEGQVVIQFVVDEEGNVVDPRVIRGIGAGCDREAVEVVRQAEFEPGRQRGRPVHVEMSLPVRFALGNEDDEGSSPERSSASNSAVESAAASPVDGQIYAS